MRFAKKRVREDTGSATTGSATTKFATTGFATTREDDG